MPRNAAGTYTLPASNPVVTGTPIQSGGWANPTMSDIGNEITNSLDRGGRGGMTGPFGVTDGSAVAPGLRFTNDPDNGLYRDVANSWWLAAGGLAIMQVTSTGVTLAPGMIASNFGASVDQNDGIPPDFIKGDLWFESDTGNFYVQYQNPDLTFSVVGLNSVSAGPYVPLASVGVANGVASLDSTGKVPSAQLPVTTPPGTVFDFAGLLAQIPVGYLNCDGASYTTAGQPTLFAAIGYIWGGGGANFNVPNLSRRATVGAGGTATGTLGNVVGNVGGEETHLLTLAELASHAHGGVQAGVAGADGTGAIVSAGTTFSSTFAVGSNTAHNTVQPSAVMLKIIKT